MRKLIRKEEYPDLRESIEFSGNSCGKFQGFGYGSASVALALCNITTSIIFIHIFKGDPDIEPTNGIRAKATT